MTKNVESNLVNMLKSISKVFILKVFGTALVFLLQIILGNKLGTNQFGEFTVLTSIVNIFILFTVFGVDSSLIRYIPRIEESDNLRKKLLYKSLIAVFFVSIVIMLFMYIFKTPIINFFKVSSETYYYIIPIIIISMSLSKVLDGFLQGEKKTDIATFFSPLLLTIVKIILFFVVSAITKKYLLSAVISVVLGEIIMLIIRGIYIINSIHNRTTTVYSEFTRRKYGEFLRYSLSLFAILGIGTLVTNIDKIIINTFVGSSQVGVYKTAESYTGLIGIFSSPLVVFWPVMSELYKKNDMKLLEKMFNFIVKLISILAVPIIVFMFIFSKELLSVFGKGFTEGSLILSILILGVTFDTMAGPVGALLNMTNYARYNLIDNIIIAFLDVGINLLLVPRIGAVGAAIATVTCMITINFVNIIQNKILLNVFPYDKDNIIIILLGIAIFVLDKFLYGYISINIFGKMILFGMLNYILFIGLYYIIAKPDYKTFIGMVKQKK